MNFIISIIKITIAFIFAILFSSSIYWSYKKLHFYITTYPINFQTNEFFSLNNNQRIYIGKTLCGEITNVGITPLALSGTMRIKNECFVGDGAIAKIIGTSEFGFGQKSVIIQNSKSTIKAKSIIILNEEKNANPNSSTFDILGLNKLEHRLDSLQTLIKAKTSNCNNYNPKN